MFSSQALGAPGPASPWFTRGQHQRWVWQEGVWRASQVLQWGRRAGGWSGRLLSPPGAPRFSCACGDFVRGRVMWGVLRSSHSCSVRANGRNRAGWAGAPPWAQMHLEPACAGEGEWAFKGCSLLCRPPADPCSLARFSRWHFTGWLVRHMRPAEPACSQDAFPFSSTLQVVPVYPSSPSCLQELWHGFPNLSNSKNKTLLWLLKKKKRRPEDSGTEPQRMQAIWGNIPQNTASSLSGPQRGRRTLLVLNIHQLSPGGSRRSAEHNGTSRWSKQSRQMFTAIKSCLHQLQGFHGLNFIFCLHRGA